MSTVPISVFRPDRPGVAAAIPGHLFEVGADRGDAGFAMPGAGGKFTSVCDMPQLDGASKRRKP